MMSKVNVLLGVEKFGAFDWLQVVQEATLLALRLGTGRSHSSATLPVFLSLAFQGIP